VIFYVDSQSFLAYFLRRTLGDRPGCQRPVDLKSEIKMQAAGCVPLDDENRPFIFAEAAFGFRCLLKLSLAIIFFERGHGVPWNDYNGCRNTIQRRKWEDRAVPGSSYCAVSICAGGAY